MMVIFGLTTQLQAELAPAKARTDRTASAAATSAAGASWTVRGWGETGQDAEQVALSKAREEVLVYLANQEPPLEWTPSVGYVNDHLVKRRSEATSAEAAKRVGAEIEMTLYVEVNKKDIQDMLREDQKLRVQHRQLFLAKILAGLVAFLAAVTGYFRLDEATKGYYTGWLRLAAVGLVGGIGAGLWLIS